MHDILRETMITLRDNGFTPVIEHGKKHLKVKFGRQTLVMSISPSDHRAHFNNRKILRRLIAKERSDDAVA